MRLLVAGGRDFSDREQLYRVLDQLHAETPLTALIHGAARGADTLAASWARVRQVAVVPCPADWCKYGRSAGPIRNLSMLCEHAPDMVLAFPGGHGTANMVSQARQRGVLTAVVTISGEICYLNRPSRTGVAADHVYPF